MTDTQIKELEDRIKRLEQYLFKDTEWSHTSTMLEQSNLTQEILETIEQSAYVTTTSTLHISK